MSVESVKIESDEDGFHLIVATDGEFDVDIERATFDFRLDGNAAVELLGAAMEQIAPWHTEGQSVLRDFEHYQRTGERPDYIPAEHERKGNGAHCSCGWFWRPGMDETWEAHARAEGMTIA